MSEGFGDKPLVWLHGEIRTPPFSTRARIDAGVLLRRLQRGEILTSTTRSQGEMMHRTKVERLRKAGWRVGAAAEFLELSPEEAAFVELRLALSDTLRARRTDLGLTQAELAERLGSSQSRVAKMEASDPSVSVDLLIRGLLATGASRSDIAGAIGRE